MADDALIRRFHHYAGYDEQVSLDADSLIGVFQNFRPDGRGIAGLLDGVEAGDGMEQRLEKLFASAGDDRRPQGGRDAYFIVRKPPPLLPQRASELGSEWLEGIRRLAVVVDDSELVASLTPMPSIRVLEGLPPKHPKAEDEKSRLLKALQQNAANLVRRLDAPSVATTLQPAFYFIACDSMLRDYLMWPLYRSSAGLDDPLDAYFELWRHGVKYRVFGDSQVDLYLPRPNR